MRISAKHLRQYCSEPLPSGPHNLRELLDDVGIEVKRVEDDGAAFAVELLANRGDHRCYAGVAREVVGRVGGSVRTPPSAELTIGDSPIPLRLETDLCLLYTATAIDIANVEQSLPEEILHPLIEAGLQPVNAAVDTTNLANLEFGQPTHLFDADTIVGGITIREAKSGETAWPLFSDKRVTVPEGSIVIADDEKILAIAGVIGCEESKVTATTTKMLLESACFDPVAVRKAGRTLNIHTDSSARFERGSDPSLPLIGAGRVVHLLENHAGAKRAGSTGVVGNWTDPNRLIGLSVSRVQSYLHHALDASECQERLERYGFDVQADGEHLQVKVPPGRLWDVEHPEDLYEEIAKSIGYNALPEAMPSGTVGVQPSDMQQLRSTIESVLLGAGFYETITDGFYGRSLPERLLPNSNHPLQAHVETLNSLDKGYSLLKNQCLGQALLGLNSNIRMGLKQVRLFEFTRTFHPNAEADNGLCTERHVVWGLIHGSRRDPTWADRSPAADIWFLKGLVEELSTALGIPLRLATKEAASDPTGSLLHPYRRAAILRGDTLVGVLGEVDPARALAMGLKKARPCYFELNVHQLEKTSGFNGFVAPSARPLSTRSLAFSLPPRVEAADVLDTLAQHRPDWLEQVQITDLFEHREDDIAMRAVTFVLHYRNDESERTTDELNAATERLAEQVLTTLGSRGVRQRI